MKMIERLQHNSNKSVGAYSERDSKELRNANSTFSLRENFSRGPPSGETMHAPVYFPTTRHFLWMTKCVGMKSRKCISRSHIMPAVVLMTVVCVLFCIIQACSLSHAGQIGRNSSTSQLYSLRQYLVRNFKGWSAQNDQIRRLTMVKEQNRFPSCIIFGVSKGGTRAVCEYLKLHPDVVAPSDEIHFYDNLTLQKEKGVDWYLRQMPASKPNQITVEKSPDYFQHPQSARLIYETNNCTKLLLLLRDPVERLISQYMQLVEKNPSLPAFEEWVIDPITGEVNVKHPSVMVSAYSQYLGDWLSVFPRDQIHIIESDSLRVHPLEEMKIVEEFLKIRPYFTEGDFYFNVSRGFYCNRIRATGKTKCLGKSKGREHIPVKSEILERLHKFYLPYNQELNRILKMKFPWS
ncbi:heparan sulfate glucosamine 3-O-sulfotransferase 5 [Aplysia californica]|uniref:Heparan sulfate glucosamine 3-O-sulfotransferase 5 n=1 Tax=Aplysia californica TaxID=6500 RepID=A0ABM1A5W4_APLCA|nr:heparan sulfate glucosamine 3-O-sulfotransferase 5 [Aplysia californica]